MDPSGAVCLVNLPCISYHILKTAIMKYLCCYSIVDLFWFKKLLDSFEDHIICLNFFRDFFKYRDLVSFVNGLSGKAGERFED